LIGRQNQRTPEQSTRVLLFVRSGRAVLLAHQFVERHEEPVQLPLVKLYRFRECDPPVPRGVRYPRPELTQGPFGTYLAPRQAPRNLQRQRGIDSRPQPIVKLARNFPRAAADAPPIC